MRVIFVNPSRAGHGNIPINLPLLQALAKAKGHEARIFDFSDYHCFQPATLESDLTQNSESDAPGKWSRPGLYFKKTNGIDVERVKSERKRAFAAYEPEWLDRNREGLLCSGDPEQDFTELCESFQPQVVAVSSLTVDFPLVARFLQKPKERFGFFCVVGGAHAISVSDHAISHPVVDATCVGDGDTAFGEFLERLEHKDAYWKTTNMWVKYNGHVHKNPVQPFNAIDDLPFLDFEGFDPLHFYRPFDGSLYRMLNYSWARGCPYACSYCINALRHSQTGFGVRRKSPQRAIQELKALVSQYAFDFIRFWDEDFTAIHVNGLRQFLDLYQQEIRLPYLVYARAESLTEEKIQLLVASGCKTVAMGVESGSEFIRKEVLNRPISNKRLVEAFNLVHRLGLRVSAYNIIGLPKESRERIFETINLNRLLPIATCSCTLLEPYPNTPIRKMCEDEGLPVDHYPTYGGLLGRAQFIPRDMTRSELEGLFKTFPLYTHLPDYLFPVIKIAEHETPEGRAVFDALVRLKAEHHMEKPCFEDAKDDDPTARPPSSALP